MSAATLWAGIVLFCTAGGLTGFVLMLLHQDDEQ